MNNATTQTTSSRRKLLIPGLLLVLLIVLVWPKRASISVPSVPSVQSKPELSQIAATSNATSNATTAATSTHFTSVAVDSTQRMPALPAYTLTDAIAINPFDPPTAVITSPSALQPTEPVVEPHVEIVEDQPPAPQVATQLQAIFFDQSGAAAIIEDRIFRTGDKLMDGRKILSITRQGVELTP